MRVRFSPPRLPFYQVLGYQAYATYPDVGAGAGTVCAEVCSGAPVLHRGPKWSPTAAGRLCGLRRTNPPATIANHQHGGPDNDAQYIEYGDNHQYHGADDDQYIEYGDNHQHSSTDNHHTERPLAS